MFGRFLMHVRVLAYVSALLMSLGALAAQTEKADASPHKAIFVTVEPGVKLQVLDWGGTGRPLVFLAGLGGTAHSFDTFASNFTGRYHVIGITRRGYAPSDMPAPTSDSYDADRLGDDVLSVLDQLNLQNPVLVGHSFAGEEMSSVGSRFPNRVAGLIYLDAAFRYAFSPVDRGDFQIDTLELKRRLDAVLNAISPGETKAALGEILKVLPQYEKDLMQQSKDMANAADMTPAEYAAEKAAHSTPEGQIEDAALHGERRYTSITCPVLAFFALPHDKGLPPGPKRDAADAAEMKYNGFMAADFQAGVPTAHVVRIPHARHEIYISNEAQVVQEMNAFLVGLK